VGGEAKKTIPKKRGRTSRSSASPPAGTKNKTLRWLYAREEISRAFGQMGHLVPGEKILELLQSIRKETSEGHEERKRNLGMYRPLVAKEGLCEGA